jgi:hypothetical protein
LAVAGVAFTTACASSKKDDTPAASDASGGEETGGTINGGAGANAGHGGMTSAGGSAGSSTSSGGRGMTPSAGTGGGGGNAGKGGASAGGVAGMARGGSAGARAGSPSGGMAGSSTPTTCTDEFIAEQAEALVTSFESPTSACIEGTTGRTGVNSLIFDVTSCSDNECDGEPACGGMLTWTEALHFEAQGDHFTMKGIFDEAFACTVRFETDSQSCDCTTTKPGQDETWDSPFAAVATGSTLTFKYLSVMFSGGTGYTPSITCSGDVIPDPDSGEDACNGDTSQVSAVAEQDCRDRNTQSKLTTLSQAWIDHVQAFTADCGP